MSANRQKRHQICKQVRDKMRNPISGVPKDTESSEIDENETDTEDENEDNGRTIDSENDSSIGIRTVATTAAIVPQEVTEKRTMNNCLISTITHSVDGQTRFIPKDYFIKFDQRVKAEYKTQYNKEWLEMRNEIEREIDQDIQLRMVRRAQQVGLYVIDENTGKKSSFLR